MFRVSFQGLRKARYLPSGEISAAAISGLPKRISRSISGGNPLAAEDFLLLSFAPIAVTNSTRQKRLVNNLFMAGTSFLSKRAVGSHKWVQRIVSASGNCCPVIRGLTFDRRTSAVITVRGR